MNKELIWSEIDINQLQNKTDDEIKIIAESIGVTITGNSKFQLINKIRLEIKIITTKTKYLNKTINNPFNKSTFDQLVIDIGTIEGKNELLFWKIIKNKTIYNHIVSFLNVYPNSLNYDYIISVDKMLKNNQISILKDKVKCNSYITFSGIEGTASVWKNIFRTIQNQDDKEFYQNLFKNYLNQLCIDNKQLYRVCDYLIESGCRIGLMVLVEIFNFKATNDTIHKAFGVKGKQNGTLDCINYLIDPNTPSLINFQSFKIDEYNQITQFGNYTNIIKTIEMIECFVQLYKPTKKFILNNLLGFLTPFSTNPFDHPLKVLDRTIGLLNTLDLWNLYENSNFRYPNLWEEYGTIEPLSLSKPNLTFIKDEIKLFNFSRQQLDSNLNDPINRFCNEKLNIKTLLDIFYSVGHVYSVKGQPNTKYIEYHICFGNEIEKSNHLSIKYPICNDLDIYFKSSQYAMEYGDYLTLSTLFKVFNMHAQNQTFKIYTNLLKSIDCSTMFKYCLDDKEFQIQFLNSLIKDSKPTSSTMKLFDPCNIPPAFIFMLLVKYDNLELLKYYVNEMGSKENAIYTNDFNDHIRLTGIQTLSDSITKSIKSIEIMDYIFNEFYQLIEHKDFIVSKIVKDHPGVLQTCQISDINLLNHYQNLYFNRKEFEKKGAKKIFIPPTQIKFTVSFAQHVFNNVTKYVDYIQFTKHKPIDFEDCEENKEIYYSSLKNAINNSPINTSLSPFLFYHKEYSYGKFYPPIHLVKFIEWFKNKYPERIKSDASNSFENFKQFKSIPYITNGYDGIFGEQIIKTNDIISKFELITIHTIRRGDLKTFDKILTILLNEYNQTENTFVGQDFKKKIAFLLLNILNQIVGEEQILILEFILLNHCQLFKTKIEQPNTQQLIDDGLFTQSQFIKLIYKSIDGKCGLKIIEFFDDIFPINK